MEIEYIPEFVNDPNGVFDKLYNQLDFEHVGTTPRLEYYMNDNEVPYTYGSDKNAKTFHVKPWHDEVLNIRKKLEEYYGCVFDVCFINCYLHHRHHLGWHADDSPEMDDERPIVTVSLGAERQIWFRDKHDRNPDNVTKLLLGNGSACTMLAGYQKNHLHRIPKHDRECGIRMSLTFRGYVDPQI